MNKGEHVEELYIVSGRRWPVDFKHIEVVISSLLPMSRSVAGFHFTRKKSTLREVKCVRTKKTS